MKVTEVFCIMSVVSKVNEELITQKLLKPYITRTNRQKPVGDWSEYHCTQPVHSL